MKASRGRVGAALLALVMAQGAGGPALAAPGARPPSFSLRAAPGTAWRGQFRLSDHLGQRPILISFFATWCRPCEVELPALQKLRDRFGDKELAVVGVAIDGPETAGQIGAMARRLRLAFPIVHDADTSVAARFTPQRTVPFLVMVDRRGRVVRERAGFSPAEQRALPDEVAALVSAPP
jgi:peroxiredoxin